MIDAHVMERAQQHAAAGGGPVRARRGPTLGWGPQPGAERLNMDDFYKEYILDHYRNPRNFGHLGESDGGG